MNALIATDNHHALAVNSEVQTRMRKAANIVEYARYMRNLEDNTKRRQRKELSHFDNYLYDMEHKIIRAKQQMHDMPVIISHAPIVVKRNTYDNLQDFTGVDYAIIIAFRETMLAKGYAVGTINAAIATIRKRCQYASENGYITQYEYSKIKAINNLTSKEDSARDVTRRPNAKKSKRTKFTQFELEKMIDGIDTSTESGKRDKVIFCMLAYLGIRASTLQILTIEDIDFDNFTIDIFRVKTKTKSILYLTKSDGNRLEIAMRDYLALECMNEGALLRAGVRGGRLTSKQMSIRGISKRIEKIGNENGISKLSPHDFRHNFVTEQGRRGASRIHIQSMGGWSSGAMIDHYLDSEEIGNEHAIFQQN